MFCAEAVGGLPVNETTMAAALKPAGYRTMIIGKWVGGTAPVTHTRALAQFVHFVSLSPVRFRSNAECVSVHVCAMVSAAPGPA